MESLRRCAGEVATHKAVIELGAPAELYQEQNRENNRPRPVRAISVKSRRLADGAVLAWGRTRGVHGVTAVRKANESLCGNDEETGVWPSIAGAIPPLWSRESIA